MMSLSAKRLKSLLGKFIRFGVVGLSGMVVDYGVLLLLREVCNVQSYIAVAISFLAAATSNYFLNRLWTFRSHEPQVGKEYLRFITVSIIGLGITELVIWLSSLLLPSWAEDWRFYILKFFAIVVTTLWNFFGNLLFTFRKQNDQ